jgi:hypothetical protein
MSTNFMCLSVAVIVRYLVVGHTSISVLYIQASLACLLFQYNIMHVKIANNTRTIKITKM